MIISFWKTKVLPKTHTNMYQMQYFLAYQLLNHYSFWKLENACRNKYLYLVSESQNLYSGYFQQPAFPCVSFPSASNTNLSFLSLLFSGMDSCREMKSPKFYLLEEGKLNL